MDMENWDQSKLELYMVVWRSSPDNELPASHEGMSACSPEEAISGLQEDLADDEIAVAAYIESQVRRMGDFLRRLRLSAQPDKAPFIVFYDSLIETKIAPCDPLGEGWFAVWASDGENALEIAAERLDSSVFVPFLWYDESDVEMIANALHSSKLACTQRSYNYGDE